jgi:hypothetical protein
LSPNMRGSSGMSGGLLRNPTLEQKFQPEWMLVWRLQVLSVKVVIEEVRRAHEEGSWTSKMLGDSGWGSVSCVREIQMWRLGGV